MITLRTNQTEPVRKGVEFFKQKKPKPSLIIAPTAFGKSIVISKIAHEVNDKIIVLQPSKELLEQNLSKLEALGGSASVYSASMGIKEIGQITYATIGSIKSIGSKFRSLGFTKMIIDEADRFPRTVDGMLRTFLKDSGITHVLGLTATPLKLQTNSFMMQSYSILKMLTSKSKHGNFFKEIIHVCQVKEMIELGYWSKLLYEVYDFDTGKLIFNSSKAEYTEQSITDAYNDQNIESKIIKKVQESDRKSILIFVPSVAQAISLSAKIPNSQPVYGDMDKKIRAVAIEDFKNLKLRVVVNVNVLSIGFDHPELDCIISGRPTASLSWWYQAIGRITRIHPKKDNGLIIDFAGNTPKFGKVEELYYKQVGTEWKLFGEEGKLLTGIPMHEIGDHTEATDLAAELGKQQIEKDCIITFGKYSGKKVSETSPSWRDWMIMNFDFTPKTEYIREEIIRLHSEKVGS